MCVETGLPAIFKFATKGEGYTKSRRAHFSHAAGDAPTVSHIFDKKKRYTSIRNALTDGAKILLNLNFSLPYAEEDFSKARDSSIVGTSQWKLENKYFNVSIESGGEIFKHANHVNKLGGNANGDVFISSQNGVMPFDEFFVGQNKIELEKLRDDMEFGKSGIPKGETRVIGSARAVWFNPTRTTWNDNGVKGIKGNYQKHSDRAHKILSYLIFSERDDEQQKQARAQAMEIFRQNPQHIYLVACPTISVGYDRGKGYLKNIRWIINDVAKQIIAAPEARMLNFKNTGQAEQQQYVQNSMPTQQLSLIK